MEWNIDLDIALRSVPWTPIQCSDSTAEDRLFLAKFLVSDAGQDAGRSCCLLLFDAESGQSFFEPLRTSRILKRCAHVELNAASSMSESIASSAATGASQDDSEARLHAILTRLERVFSLARSGHDPSESTSYSIQGSRYATTLDIRTRSKADSNVQLSFTFEADSLDHEHASSVFLNHWALPLLGVGSAMRRILQVPSIASKESFLLPEMQQAVDQSATAAQQDHGQPFLDVFRDPMLSTSLTRWSETHLRREQPRVILTSFADTEPVQAKNVDRSPVEEENTKRPPTSPRRTFSPPTVPVASSSREATFPSPPLIQSPANAPPNKRPSPSDDEAINPSPNKRYRNDIETVEGASGTLATGLQNDDTISETGTDDTAPEETDFDDSAEEFPANDPPRAGHNIPPPIDVPMRSPPLPTASELVPPPMITAERESAVDLEHPSASHPSSGQSIVLKSSPTKAGPAPSRTVLAPLRKGGAPARGTARSRRF
ncbi:hypothetical protein CF319_g1808 [Tilletia indica]|nr:hypothetical protein CF319_g1808 [Tilletia indica]